MQAAGSQLQNMLKCFFLYRAEHRRVRCACHRRMQLTAQQRHFAEKVSSLNVIEHFLPAAATLLGDFDRAFAYQIKRVAQVAFFKNDITALELQDVDVGPDSFQHLRPDALKEAVLTQLRESLCGRGSHRFFQTAAAIPLVPSLDWSAADMTDVATARISTGANGLPTNPLSTLFLIFSRRLLSTNPAISTTLTVRDIWRSRSKVFSPSINGIDKFVRTRSKACRSRRNRSRHSKPD